MNGLTRAVPSLILMLGSALTVFSCTDFDDARAEFCDNADPVSQKDVCGRGAVACLKSEDCPAPEGACFDSSVCEDGRCVPRPKAEEAPCSEPVSTQCFQTAGVCRSGACVRPATPGKDCNDGSECTVDDRCTEEGTCVGKASCGELPSPCYQWADGCTNGVCTLIRKPIGTPCSDGNACTVQDQCSSTGECIGTTLTCATQTPPSQCHEWNGTCSNNACDFRRKSIGTDCSDGNACTDKDYCNGSGQCVSGGTTQCADRSRFCEQLELCDPDAGCQYHNICKEYGPGYFCKDGACCRDSLNVSTGLPEEMCPVRRELLP
ncbi:hypothetical protein SAMN05443639_102589 [Stigmatella erecta]|uniref:Dickkopf N-terminal cysteine-rich domain-containing protein n=1 Tax=Stigmatella erecta TaxID=83460 RepID=A0A1I0DNS5_9BACT|nr:hypothetical protein SAMN05443639_102589 [Stigmatella erecta]